MKLSFKKVVGVILAVLMIASSMSAFACANDKFIAYDLIPDVDGKYGKLYKCPEEGIVRNGCAEKEEWVPAFYEAEYPHLRVDVLVLDGNDTGMIKYAEKWNDAEGKYENVYADVNTKNVPEFWEVKDPYIVYNRIYSDFTGKYEATNTIITDGVKAPVEKDWIYKGFDKYVIEDGKVVDYSHAYGVNDDKIAYEWNILDDLKNEYYADVIEGFDANGNAIYTDAFMSGDADAAYEIFEDAIRNASWLQLTGPDFATDGEKVVVPFEDIVNGKPAEWYDDTLVAIHPEVTDAYLALTKRENRSEFAEIGWKTAGYELKAPYRYYQYLTINGVEMDGSVVEIKNYDVKKEEVIDVFADMPDEIQIIEKASEIVGYESKSETSWEITPFDYSAATKVTETISKKVIENYLLETVVDRMDVITDNPAREVRFVKVSTQPGTTKMPRIWRYTGECAKPEVKWEVAFAEAAKPYEIYEEKWVKAMNGVFYPTGEYRTTGKFAEDVPTVSGAMGQPKVLTVILEGEVNEKEFKWALENSPYQYIIAGNRLNIIVPAVICEGTDDYITDINGRLADYVTAKWTILETNWVD